MRGCSRHLRRTGPAGSRNELVAPAPRSRRNGWARPLGILQIFCWFTYMYFSIVGFGIYIPLLPYPWDVVAYCLIGFLFSVHFGTHISAISIDPAEPNVRAKNYVSPLPTFDKDKHPHVILDQYCTVCEVEVGPEAKHCRACNKCVTRFDHHCKYLNNCVGKRNYWVFFVTVLTAVIGMLLFVLIFFFVFIELFKNPEVLRTAPQFQSVSNTTWLLFLPLAPVKTNSAGLLVVTIFTLLYGLASLVVLIHLLGFHFYLLYHKITTYEYIMKQRQTRNNQDVESGLNQSRATSKASTKNEPSLESVGCDSPLPSKTSSVVDDVELSPDLTTRLSTAMCAELVRIQALSAIHYYSTKLAMESAQSQADAELQEVVVTGDQASEKSGEGTPVIQNPLGSSVMNSAEVEQDASMRSESALSLH